MGAEHGLQFGQFHGSRQSKQRTPSGHGEKPATHRPEQPLLNRPDPEAMPCSSGTAGTPRFARPRHTAASVSAVDTVPYRICREVRGRSR